MDLVRHLRRLPAAPGLLCLALAAATLPAPAPVQAQEGSFIVGAVQVEGSGVPLFGAVISVLDEDLSTVTNQDGHFTFRGMEPGEFALRVGHPDHVSVVQQVTVVQGTPTFVQLALSPVAAVLDQLRVTAERSQPPGAAVSFEEMTPEPHEGSRSAMDLLQARFPSLSIRGSDSGAGSNKEVRIRGASSLFGGNTPALYIDGVRAQISFLYDLSSTEVQRIRVLKGPAAAVMYPNAANGVIIVETTMVPPGGPPGG